MDNPMDDTSAIAASLNIAGEGNITIAASTVKMEVKTVIRSAVEKRFARCRMIGDPAGKNSYKPTTERGSICAKAIELPKCMNIP
jgi:hypothetical protein